MNNSSEYKKVEDKWFDSIIKIITGNLQNPSNDRNNENISDDSFKTMIKHITNYEI